MGGFTAVPSALGTVIAGLSGGVVFLLFKRRVAPVWAAVLLAVFTESVHMGLKLLMAKPFDDALTLVGEVILPMILVNAPAWACSSSSSATRSASARRRRRRSAWRAS